MKKKLTLVLGAMAFTVLASACTATSTPAGTPTTGAGSPTTTLSVVDGSSLPQAPGIVGDYPLAEGIDEYEPEEPTTGEDEESVETERPTAKCQGFRISDVLFESGSSELSVEGSSALETLAERIPDRALIRIIGNTDDLPISIGNQRLSELRADAVAAVLSESLSSTQRIVGTAGVGDTNPIADNATEEGRAMNRRVDVLVNCDGS